MTTVKIYKQVQPSAAIINKLNKKLGDKKSYGQPVASCFEPHLGIVYYLKGKIVRNVLVCLGCNRLSADIIIIAQQQHKQGHGANAYYTGEGMSKYFRHFLNSLLIKYNFSHQIESGSNFDK